MGRSVGWGRVGLRWGVKGGVEEDGEGGGVGVKSQGKKEFTLDYSIHGSLLRLKESVFYEYLSLTIYALSLIAASLP